MKQLVKRALYAVAPDLTLAWMSARSRAHSHRVVKEWGGQEVAGKLLQRFGNSVQAGPFAGLTLTPMTFAEQVGPYLLGVYESELDDAWSIVLNGEYTQIIDIGAKFGYYAVGLGRRYPDTSVLAFDTDWWARRAIREMASANGADNVEVKRSCSAEWLMENVGEADFIISDCEGCEATIFTPEVVDQLRTATLIIETHDDFVPEVSKKLRSLFGETHDVRLYGEQSERRSATVPLEFLNEAERLLATQEVRPPQLWMLCLPRVGPNKGLLMSSGVPARA